MLASIINLQRTLPSAAFGLKILTTQTFKYNRCANTAAYVFKDSLEAAFCDKIVFT